MASRFLVAAALFAVCHSSPFLNDDVIYRNQRSFTAAEGLSRSENGPNKAYASIQGPNAEAYGQNNIANDGSDHLRSGSGQGQAFAKVGRYDTPIPIGYNRIAVAQPAYYPVPAPAAVVTYQQNVEVPSEVSYEVPAAAQSSANVHGHGSATSLAQTSGIAAPITIVENLEPAIIAAKHHGYNTVYTPANSASSTANVHGYGSAASSARAGAVPTRKSISWRFGTAYDVPESYANSAATSRLGYSSGPSLNTAAKTQGNGAAHSTANNYGAVVNSPDYGYLRAGEHFGAGTVQSTANSNGHGSAQSSANTNAGYGLRSTGWGKTDVSAQTIGAGNANSYAQNRGNGYQVVNSDAKSYGPGSARADAHSA